MKADRNTVVTFHYRVAEVDGDVIEASRERGRPMMVLLGHGQLIEGMEEALMGREAGDSFSAEVQPEKAYGAYREGMIQRMSKKYFRQPSKLQPGMTTTLDMRQGGQRPVRVHKVGMSTIDVDLNHPLAGKRLNFNIDLEEVRAGTPEELAHGHAHAPGDPAH